MRTTADASYPSLTANASCRPAEAPLYALTTFELRDYRQQLERAIARLDTIDPVPEARAGLQARLDGVIAEQADRTRLADA
jgi:hypothetical protein